MARPGRRRVRGAKRRLHARIRHLACRRVDRHTRRGLVAGHDRFDVVAAGIVDQPEPAQIRLIPEIGPRKGRLRRSRVAVGRGGRFGAAACRQPCYFVDATSLMALFSSQNTLPLRAIVP